MNSKKKELHFWEKWALKPEDERDGKISFYEVDDDPAIRQVVRNSIIVSQPYPLRYITTAAKRLTPFAQICPTGKLLLSAERLRR